MNAWLRIYWLSFLLVFIIGLQFVVGQDVNDNRLDILGLSSQTSPFILQIDPITKSSAESTVPGFIVAEPLPKQWKQLAKINGTNWSTRESKNVRLQRLSLPGNRQIYIRIDELELAHGESIAFYNSKNGTLLDIVNSSNRSHKYLAGPFLQEEILMVHDVNDASSPGKITIGEIYVGAMDFGYDSSFDCHKNIKCTEGEKFGKEERGVVRIKMVLEEGIGFCTGSLINNVREDMTPFLLSAYHCQAGFSPLFDMWEFDFGYESFSCANPATEPSFIKVIGCEQLAGHEDTDLLLLKITGDLPEETNAFFNGWNRDPDHRPDGAVLIHHPRGDIKKISVDQDLVGPHPEVLPWDNGIRTSANSHLVTHFDIGSYEGGSSGGPVLDNSGLIIGQLHGGPEEDEMCSIGIGYHGRLSSSWEGGNTPDSRLKDWLDPDDSGVLQLAGKSNSVTGSSFVTFVGRMVTPDGIAIPNVEVTINGDKEASFLTGTDGRFEFDNLPKSGSYSIQFRKNTNSGNGLSALDLVQIRNHILGTNPLRGIFQQRSADASNDGSVSSIDIVQILNVIIGRTQGFPNNNSWLFEPASIDMEPSSLNTDAFDFAIIGYKIGDVNFSANPRN